MSESSRVEREKEKYNEGLDRERYESILSHTEYFYRKRREKILKKEMEYANSRNVLELGSVAWSTIFDKFNIIPTQLNCINISESELDRGIQLAHKSKLNPAFTIMDANDLEFEEKSFDVVFGFGILHHLDYVRALDEILKVLKKDGKVVFFEPLDNNPVGRIVRFLTPNARTDDEKPLRFFELNEFRKRFVCKEYYEGFLSVPFGILSKIFFKNADNFLTRTGYRIDIWIDRHLPVFRPFFRHITLVGEPRY